MAAAARTTGYYCNKPQTLVVDETSVTGYSKVQSIDTLIIELWKKGPLVALGQIGPNHHQEAAKFKHEYLNFNVYGWDKDAVCVQKPNSYVIVLGARKVQGQELVYYCISYSVQNKTTHTLGETIYVSSHEKFKEHLVDLYAQHMMQKAL